MTLRGAVSVEGATDNTDNTDTNVSGEGSGSLAEPGWWSGGASGICTPWAVLRACRSRTRPHSTRACGAAGHRRDPRDPRPVVP